MRHPAFDTGTDTASRKAAHEQMEQERLQNEASKSAANSKANSSTSLTSSLKPSTSDSKETLASKKIGLPITAEQSNKIIESAQEATDSLLSAAQEVANALKLADEINAMLSSLCEPINSAMKLLKKIPEVLKSLVDVDGAANGMYASLDALKDTWNKFETSFISTEVPITLDDYSASPSRYPNLETLQKLVGTLTEDDCLSSGYTKIVTKSLTNVTTEAIDVFLVPTDLQAVAKTCETTLATVVKPIWDSVSMPILTIAGIANIGPLGSMVGGIVSMIEGIANIAKIPVPDEQLGQKIKEQLTASEVLANESAKAAEAGNAAAANAKEQLENAKQKASETMDKIKQQSDAVLASSKDAFASILMPTMPDGFGEALEEIWKAVLMVVANILNMFIVVLFKLLECVFKCFNLIIGVIGVPSLPYPLNVIPMIMGQLPSIMTFIMGLPMSLMNLIKAIVARKVKAMVVADMAVPPQPVPEVVPVEPTSEDVPLIDATWDDVKTMLVGNYGFSDGDAGKIVDDIQAFYDGSDSKLDAASDGEANNMTLVVLYIDEVESDVEGKVDHVPVFTYVKRILVTPAMALEQWIPTNISEDGVMDIPENGVYSPSDFWKWTYNKLGKPSKKTLPSSSLWAYLTYFAD